MADSHHEEETMGKTNDWRLVARLLCYLRPYKWRALSALALMVLNAPLMLAGPPLTQAAVDLFLLPDPSRTPYGFELFLKHCAEATGFGASRQQGIAFIALVFLLANIAAFAAHYVQRVVMETMGQHVLYDMRDEIFARLQQLPIQFYDRTPVGRLMTRITNDVDALDEMLTSGVIAVLGNAAIAAYVVIWMFGMSWRLTLVSFVTLPLLGLLTAWFRLAARAALRVVREQIAAINAFLQEHVASMQVVQLFNREAKEMGAFDRINRAHWKAKADANLCNAIFYPAVEIIGSAGIALAIWYGGGQVVRGLVSLGALIAFIELVETLYYPISELSQQYNSLQAGMASAERIFKLLDEPVPIESPSNCGKSLALDAVRGRLEFRNVWFAYHDDNWVLKDVSFVVEPGEKVAFVGHTGAGKTTVTNLLLRLYEIQRGQILLDDVDIRHLDLEDLRSNFSIVPQDIFLFSGDITFNIRLGNPLITEDRVKAAAREVHAEKFIAALRNGYETELLERGAGLSVGQKQLIGFARALAFDRRILVLDEATSSIDTETEILIHNAVKRLMTNRTSLVIAHRLSTIQSVDKIVVMHKGEIRESGSHRSLVAQHGLYWKLYQLQFGRGFQPTVIATSRDG
jgi:ATP-binding cassette subfamily B multidrug efflux pump